MYETIFSASGLLVLPLWALMIFAPGWSRTRWIIRSPFIALPAALLYAALVLPQLGEVLPAVLNPEFHEILALFGQPAGMTIGWVHFLAFDVFVGRWVYLDARARGVPALVSSPALFFVFMLGPLGLAAYLLLRGLFTREAPAAAELPR